MADDPTITGKVVDKDSAQGIGNLRVEVWGKLRRSGPPVKGRRFQTKKLQESTTEASGDFNIVISRGTLARLVGDKTWFQVFDRAGNKLADTQDSVIWSPQDPQAVQIEVEWEGAGGEVGPVSELLLTSDDGKVRVALDANGGSGRIGGQGVDGQVLIFPATAGDNTDPNQATIRLDGATGDILLANADCAEDFDIVACENADVTPGHVMVLEDERGLVLCARPYDKRVAGVISGAGDYRPGIVLDKQCSTEGRMPLALVGKVFCYVDADYGPIEVGDLLTTSATPGHAMKAIEQDRAFGTVLGKALRPLASGRDLIPILIALQ